MITRAPRRTVRMIRGLRGLRDFVPTLCDPKDVACVEKNAAASVAYQQQQQEVSAMSDHDRCIANGTDAATCDARWPAGYAGNVPYLNLTPQQQADQMATPTQAAYQMLTNPNVAGELHDFGLNPLNLLPTGYGVYKPLTISGSGGGASTGGQLPASGFQTGSLTFASSRGGNAFQPGDTWKITITGATPGAGVSVQGGVNGASAITSMGTIDSGGNFTKSGTFGNGDVGSWTEKWLVGPGLVPTNGQFSFTVSTPAAGTNAQGQTIINSSGAQNAPGMLPSAPDVKLTDYFGLLPWYVWVGAAAAALYAMKGKH